MNVAHLTGPYDTSELPRMGTGPVTVTVAREIVPGREAEFEAIAAELEGDLAAFPGCLGVGVLRPGPAGGEYQIVFRFTDPLSLRRWEHSAMRAKALDRMEPLIVDTRVQRVLGVEEFFELPGLVEIKRPRHRQMFGDIVWVSPVSLLVSLSVAPHLAFLPLVPRVLSVVSIMTAAMTLAVTPVRDRVRRRVRPDSF
jgi:uncharacterized protein